MKTVNFVILVSVDIGQIIHYRGIFDFPRFGEAIVNIFQKCCPPLGQHPNRSSLKEKVPFQNDNIPNIPMIH